jgi:hypothetical protein
MFSTKNRVNCFNLEQTGWKYYNVATKKAMEQEFSWSGLLISLSIAFFIVVASASALNFINHTVTAERQRSTSTIAYQ